MTRAAMPSSASSRRPPRAPRARVMPAATIVTSSSSDGAERPCCRRSGTPRPARRGPASRRGWCAGRGCPRARPWPRPAGRSGWRRTGRARCCRGRRASSPGLRAPSATGRPRRWRRRRASPQGDVRAADGGHADEVVGAGEEGGEGGGERLPAAHLQPDGGGDQLLLGDEHLEEALGVGFVEDLGVGGVRRPRRRGRRRARRRRRARPARRRRPCGWPPLRRARSAAARALPVGGGRAARRAPASAPCDRQVAYAAQFGDRPPRGRRAACRASPPCSRRPDALALEGAGDDRGGAPLDLERLRVGRVDRVDVMAVDLDRVPAEGLGPARRTRRGPSRAACRRAGRAG